MLASRHFRNNKREYLNDKIDELATHSKKKQYFFAACIGY
jgi:hypothetical protein